MRTLYEYITEQLRRDDIMELKAAGIKDISFYHYEDDGDGGVFTMEKYGDPEKYEKSFEEKLKNNGWKKEKNIEPTSKIANNKPYYSRSFVYSKNGWQCTFFKRYGYDLDGITIWFKKIKK